jgi:hypothetical protein
MLDHAPSKTRQNSAAYKPVAAQEGRFPRPKSASDLEQSPKWTSSEVVKQTRVDRGIVPGCIGRIQPDQIVQRPKFLNEQSQAKGRQGKAVNLRETGIPEITFVPKGKSQGNGQKVHSTEKNQKEFGKQQIQERNKRPENPVKPAKEDLGVVKASEKPVLTDKPHLQLHEEKSNFGKKVYSRRETRNPTTRRRCQFREKVCSR